MENKKVLCKVGCWEIMAYPGQKFTFGQGANCWGPIPLTEVKAGMDVEGTAEAVPVEQEACIMKTVVIINEQHSLLEEQEKILNERFSSGWELFKIPSEGLTIEQQKEIVENFLNMGEITVIFCSPVPFLLKEISHFSGYGKCGNEVGVGVRGYGIAEVLVFHNDNREKK